MPRATRTRLLPHFRPIRNSELFSNHWLEHRLPLEPDWRESRAQAQAALAALLNLWRVQRERVAQYGSEQALEQAFIQPVLQILGWKLIYQTHLRGRKPDYALFISDEGLDSSLSAGRLSTGFWKFPATLADAKAWHVSLDRRGESGQQREYPPEQIEWYLNNSHLDYGILTNGKAWRLIPREHAPGQPRFQTFFECKLTELLDERLNRSSHLPELWPDFDHFLQFFLFFSPTAFVSTLERPALLERARKGSSQYRVGVGEGLKERVFEALRLCIEGFFSHAPNALRVETDRETCRQQSLILLYRLLFILYAEDRTLLPYRVDRSYTMNRSLGRVRDEIAARLDRINEGRDADYRDDECSLWPDLVTLFDLINSGASRYKVPAYDGGLFDAERHTFLATRALPDRYLARVIDQLGRTPQDPLHPETPLVRVDYRDLAIQHLGMVYEGLLELEPDFADQDMVVIRNRMSEKHEELVVPNTPSPPRGFEFTGAHYPRGSAYLRTDKGERRATGSYYTPNNIVDEIVEMTLGALCADIDSRLREEIAHGEDALTHAAGDGRAVMSRALETLRSDFDDRVLRLRILDPAMGSGHFLIRACQYLAEQIATNPKAQDPLADSLSGDEPTLTYWKRRVVETCLFGVDKNPMAVELAKLALWLETVSGNQPLSFLDHHLRHGNSLVGAAIHDLQSLPDAPPLMGNVFDERIKESLPPLLRTLSAIVKTPSDTIEQVKQKERLFRRQFEPMRRPFRQVADAWCSTFFLPESDRLTLQQYEAMLKCLNKPKKFSALMGERLYRSAVQVCGENGLGAFHWQLEFPEVFFEGNAARRDAGFDAVIGNPPYDVLSEKETGQELSHLKEFLKHGTLYAPSFVDKNNLYKLFVCRALSLLSEQGRLGFIVPMALLGDKQARGIRELVFTSGVFTHIEAFPQKDNPSKRVFRDAKLATAIIGVKRTARGTERAKRFKVRVHPENRVEKSGACFELSSGDIPLYDPENLTIASCSQADWDLAVRILQSGRCTRLGTLCTSYQGEVNETNEKKRQALSADRADGPLVLRGSNICLYALREASQGEDLYLREDDFRRGKSPESKAFHSAVERIGFQRSSPQNTFRRLIACYIPPGNYCFDTVSYIPISESRVPLFFVLALLNSKLLDWYFRLGSTNSKVNEYQFNILPCPVFRQQRSPHDKEMERQAQSALRAGTLEQLARVLAAGMTEPPFSLAVLDAIVESARIICQIEEGRGCIARTDRSHLAPVAQPYQDFIDRSLYTLAGLTEAEAEGLESRLGRML